MLDLQRDSMLGPTMVPFRVPAGPGDLWAEPGCPEDRPGDPRDGKWSYSKFRVEIAAGQGPKLKVLGHQNRRLGVGNRE